MPNWEAYQEAHSRGILPEDKKAIYEEAIKRGMIPGKKPHISLPSPADTMANVPPLSPQQELSPPSDLTPKEREQVRRDVSHFIWPGMGQAKRDIVKGVTPALEIGGATAGSFAGPLGTALGFAGGGRVGKTFESLTGVSESETLPEATLNTAKDIGIGLIPWAVGKAARVPRAVAETVTKPWTKASKINQIFETVGGRVEPSIAGKSTLDRAKNRYIGLSGQGNKLYETAKGLAPEGSPANMKSIYSSVDETLKDEMASPAEKAFAEKILKKISPDVRTGQKRFGLSPELQQEILEKAEGVTGIASRPSTIQEAYALRSELSKETTKGGSVGWRASKFLDALDQDLIEATNKIGAPEAKKAFQDAINFWRDRVIPQRETVKMLSKRSIEKIPSLLTTDIKTVQQLKSTLPTEGFEDLRRGLLTDISNRVENNPVKTAAQLRKLLATKKEVMQTVFTDEELGAIRVSADPGKLGRYFEEHPGARKIAKYLGWMAAGILGYETGAKIFKYGRHSLRGPGSE